MSTLCRVSPRCRRDSLSVHRAVVRNQLSALLSSCACLPRSSAHWAPGDIPLVWNGFEKSAGAECSRLQIRFNLQVNVFRIFFFLKKKRDSGVVNAVRGDGKLKGEGRWGRGGPSELKTLWWLGVWEEG